MDKLTDTAVPAIERKCGSPFNSASSPEELFHRISFLKVISGPWHLNITFSAYQLLISQQMLSTGIAKPWKKKTDNVVKQIIEITHAASIIP